MNRTIHFFWTSPDGNSEVPHDVAANITEWAKTHPNYARKIWSEADIKAMAREVGRHDVVEAMEASRFPAMKSDIARVALMAFKGGVYSDLKNKPLATFLDQFTGQSRPVVTRHPPTIDDYARFISNAFFCSERGQPFFLELLDRIVGNVNQRKPGGVHDITGCGALKRLVGDPARDDVRVVVTEDIWGGKGQPKYISRTRASYNGASMEHHWSKLQGGGLYND